MDTSVTLFSIAYIVILIVPGIIFKRFYFQGAFSGQFNSGLFADRIITSLFWGILVQIISVLTFSQIINVSYEDWHKMLETLLKNISKGEIPNATSDQLLNVLYYAIFSVALAAIFGFSIYKMIRACQLDLKVPAFRFLNQWHYYFRGEILGTPEFKSASRGIVISTEVDLMLRTDDGKSNLFCGLLTQYTLNNKNELDTLYLTGTTRFSKSQNQMKAIPGDIFIVPFSTVQNINVRYNFKVRQNAQTFKKLALFISGILMIGSLTYPWFTGVGLWLKLFGALTLFSSWLFFSSLLMSFFPPSSGTHPLSKSARFASLILLIIFLVASILILKSI